LVLAYLFGDSGGMERLTVAVTLFLSVGFIIDVLFVFDENYQKPILPLTAGGFA
jgi:hypothetical protein